MEHTTGKEFKEKFGTEFYKVLTKNLTHNKFEYKVGEVNVDHVPFDPSGECKPGGLYFTNIENILRFIEYGPYIGRIEIPDDANVYIEEDKFKADRLMLLEVIRDEAQVLEIFKKSREKGCPWNEWTFTAAAKNGNSEVLKWLLKKGCPWDRWTFRAAAESGNLETLKWLLKKK